MTLSNTKIGHRLTIGIAAATILLLSMILVSHSRLGDVKQQLDVITSDRLPKIIAVKDAKENIRARALVVRNIVLLNDPTAVNAEVAELAVLRTAYGNLDDRLRHTIKTQRGTASLIKAEAAVRAIGEPTDQVIALARQYKKEEALKLLFDVVQPAQNAALEALEDLAQGQIDATKEFQAKAGELHRSAVTLLFSLGIASALMLIFFGWLLARSITRPLVEAVDISQAVAAGDLRADIPTGGASETAQLLSALNTMQSGLRSVVANVLHNAKGVAAASLDITTGNNNLSSRTVEQAMALQETVTSMEQLSNAVAQNADHAEQANSLAQNASAIAAHGGTVMHQVVETMKEINTSSRRVAEIVSVIDAIAFQTNILALNAAVEAARAGEQGLGFAVVAAEVRTLAQRSAQAAREIKALVAASVERVDAGTDLVEQAGTTMNQIVSSIQAVTTIMVGISEASQQQSIGVSQVSQAVARMDRTTQQNAALVEQSAAAAESLKSKAEQMLEVVSVFKLA